MKTIERNCLKCNIIFNAPLKEVKRGNGKFCSVSCVNKFYKGTKKPVVNNFFCRYCNNPIYRTLSKQKTSRNKLFFCNKVCKDLAQRTESGIHELNQSRKSKKNKESRLYTAIAKRNLPLICNKCSYNKIIEVLEVHHKDRNRKNNELSNLEILCPTCHQEEHFFRKDGRFNKVKKIK